ncbi:hypothetical protein F8388_020229 [Cannabis sativa]|uniref:Uncharacterized protein n=1 Tax=Cannabis sativa TaxID=3483 RepID=A0A7J6FVK9_CANSA|nr:hypothetical protein F8388_020229 [Cannabis sativa]
MLVTEVNVKDDAHNSNVNIYVLVMGSTPNISSYGVGVVDDSSSMNEDEHEMIQHIISNLYELIKHRVGENNPMFDLAHTDTLDYPDKLTSIHEENNRKAMKENHQLAEEIHQQALLNLWLEAEGALCSMKYEDCILIQESYLGTLISFNNSDSTWDGLWPESLCQTDDSTFLPHDPHGCKVGKLDDFLCLLDLDHGHEKDNHGFDCH